jgi:hypothetical protein
MKRRQILENLPFSEKLPWKKISWENFHASMDIFLGCWTSQVKTGQNYNDHSG